MIEGNKKFDAQEWPNDGHAKVSQAIFAEVPFCGNLRSSLGTLSCRVYDRFHWLSTPRLRLPCRFRRGGTAGGGEFRFFFSMINFFFFFFLQILSISREMEKLKNLKKSILSSYFIERKLQICSVFMKFMKSELITIRRQAGNLKNSKNIFSLHRENCRLRKVIKESLKKFEESCTFSNFIKI